MTFEPSKFSNTTFGAPARRNLQTQHSLMQMSTKSAPSMQMAPNAKQPAEQQLAAQFAQHQLANQSNSNSNTNAHLNHSLMRFAAPTNLPTVVANNRHVFAPSNSSSSNTPKIQSPSFTESTQFHRQFQPPIVNVNVEPPVDNNNNNNNVTFTARTFNKTLLDSSLGSQDDNSDAIGIESDQAAIASLSNKPPTPSPPVKKRPHQQTQAQFTDENENNNVTNEAATSTYDELRRDEAALWSMLSATYAQCRAIEQQLSECHNRLQRHASNNAVKRRRAHRRT